MGAIAGGAVGNAIGNGGGRAVATMIGIMCGAILGDNVGGKPQGQYVPTVNGVATVPAPSVYYAQPYYPPVSIEVGPRYWGHRYHRSYG